MLVRITGDPYGQVYRYAVPNGDTVVFKVGSQQEMVPTFGMSWAVKADPESASTTGQISVESHLGDVDPVSRELSDDGWLPASIPPSGESTADVGAGIGDAYVGPLSALRFRAIGSDLVLFVRLGQSPQGIPAGY